MSITHTKLNDDISLRPFLLSGRFGLYWLNKVKLQPIIHVLIIYLSRPIAARNKDISGQVVLCFSEL